MTQSDRQPFSWNWVGLSLVIYITVQLLLGALLAQLLWRNMGFHTQRLLIEALLNLVSYFVGGILIGVISPGVRIWEPALAAVLAVGLVLSFALFTPYCWVQFSLSKFLIGGAIAFGLAFAGARIGERWMGNKV